MHVPWPVLFPFPQIRKQAIKDLPSLCKDNKEHTQKIADILAQLLQAEDNAELSVVHNSLMTLFKSDAKGRLYEVHWDCNAVSRPRWNMHVFKLCILKSEVFITVTVKITVIGTWHCVVWEDVMLPSQSCDICKDVPDYHIRW